jgi:hypothetical protein
MSLQFKHGNYTTKNFDMCADAVKMFDKAVEKEDADTQAILKAARAVDKYLGIEKKAKEKGSATKAQLDSFMDAVEEAKTLISDAGLTGHTYHKWHIADMKKYAKKGEMKEGLADLAQRAEQDHEVQMARADLYKLAKYAIKLHDMLKGVSEEEGLMGWQQAKITKAADYISSVYHNLDYKMQFGDGQEMEMPPEEGVAEGKSPHKKGTKKYKKHMAAMHAGMKEDAYKSNLQQMLERKMSSAEKSKEEELKKKYDDSEMKANMKKQYGKDWEDVYYATIRKKAMKKGAK